MSRNPEMTAELRTQLEDIVAVGVFTYTHGFTKDLFPDFTQPEVQDCIVAGLVQAIARYQKATRRPIAQALGLALLDLAQE